MCLFFIFIMLFSIHGQGQSYEIRELKNEISEMKNFMNNLTNKILELKDKVNKCNHRRD